LTTGTSGAAGFKQTFTVEGKAANIVWPTKNGNVGATSQNALIRKDKVVIVPEVSH
jgi:hypothetical protein